MTDINKLAQSLRAAAENAIGAHERLAAYPYGEIIDISQHEGEQIDIDITDLNEFNKEANPVNILSLVEALEKAQAKIIELQHGYEIDPRTHEIIDMQERIAELESRTVKLPKLKMLEDYLSEVAIEERKQILVGVKLEFHRACVAAGIKVEAE